MDKRRLCLPCLCVDISHQSHFHSHSTAVRTLTRKMFNTQVAILPHRRPEPGPRQLINSPGNHPLTSPPGFQLLPHCSVSRLWLMMMWWKTQEITQTVTDTFFFFFFGVWASERVWMKSGTRLWVPDKAVIHGFKAFSTQRLTSDNISYAEKLQGTEL